MFRHSLCLRLGRLALVLAGLLVVCATQAGAFAEEPLSFRDPSSGETTDEQISTIHADLTYVLALAAGFTAADAARLEIWDQLVDSEQLGPGATVTYSNCSGAFNPPPDPADVCPPGGDYAQVAWPLWAQMKDAATCVTSRYGPYMPFFHFPHQDAAELGALHDWGWGRADRLVGYEAYAWGAASVMEATCRYTRTAVISTTIRAGSLEAFATYLHALADSYSHRECIAAMDALGLPWATHTLRYFNDIWACNYNPANPTNYDAHGREFGDSSPYDSQRTDEAVRAVYGELVARSRQREGRYLPLELDTRLAGMSGAPTLDQALHDFVHNWPYNQPGGRRGYADEMASAILAQRVGVRKGYLPLLLRY